MFNMTVFSFSQQMQKKRKKALTLGLSIRVSAKNYTRDGKGGT
jgi:hypothetical protein